MAVNHHPAPSPPHLCGSSLLQLNLNSCTNAHSSAWIVAHLPLCGSSVYKQQCPLDIYQGCNVILQCIHTAVNHHSAFSLCGSSVLRPGQLHLCLLNPCTTRSRPFIDLHFFVTMHHHLRSDIRKFPKTEQVKQGSSSTSQKCGMPGFHENQFSQQELSMCSKRSPRIKQGHMSCALVKLCQRVLKRQDCLPRLGTGGLCSSHPIGWEVAVTQEAQPWLAETHTCLCQLTSTVVHPLCWNPRHINQTTRLTFNHYITEHLR